MADLNEVLPQLLADLEEDAVLDLVKQHIDAGEDPVRIIHACNDGIRLVGQRYEAGEYFISGLIMSGEIFREVMDLVKPILVDKSLLGSSGKILIGTVAGDIHDIGKNIAGMLLTCHGFTVIDLGTDVADVEFARKAVETQPDIVGLSGLISSSFASMKNTISVLRTISKIYNLNFPIIIGGAIVDEQICRFVGADYWITDVMKGVDLCQSLVKSKNSPK